LDVGEQPVEYGLTGNCLAVEQIGDLLAFYENLNLKFFVKPKSHAEFVHVAGIVEPMGNGFADVARLLCRPLNQPAVFRGLNSYLEI
jgi:hypothetical protein